MNSKIKILLGVFFVFALLTPIYAGTLKTTRLIPITPGGNLIDGITDKVSDEIIIGPIGEKEDFPDFNVTQTRILAKENTRNIFITGKVKSTDINITYNIQNTTISGTCRIGGIKTRLPPISDKPGVGVIEKEPIEAERISLAVAKETNDPNTKTVRDLINLNDSFLENNENSVVKKDDLDSLEVVEIPDTGLDLGTLRKNFTCVINVSGMEEGKYQIKVTATKPLTPPKKLQFKSTKQVELIVDRSAPIVTVDDMPSTSTRNPILTGTVEDLTKITNFEIRVNGTSYTPAFRDGGKIWEVQLNRLPRGTHTVWFSATDELGHKTEDEKADAITIRSATGTGTRVRGTTTTPTVNPTPTPVTPAPQPVVTTPTVVNTPTPQPVVTTPTTPTPATSTETAPTTGNVAVANPEKTSGTTGFLGLSENASTGIALLIGALLVIGALGYFLFFARDKKEKE